MMNSSVSPWRMPVKAIDMASSACSGSTAMVWRRNSGRMFSGIFKMKLSEIMIVDSFMDLRSSGPSSSITRYAVFGHGVWAGLMGMSVCRGRKCSPWIRN